MGFPLFSHLGSSGGGPQNFNMEILWSCYRDPDSVGLVEIRESLFFISFYSDSMQEPIFEKFFPFEVNGGKDE